MADRFDAVLLLSFGGPEGPDDVMPFLENVTRGRGVPPERLAVVAEQYARFGGVSPINQQNRDLQTALQTELDRRGRDVPVYWGNRNWAPYVEDVMADLAAAGHERVLALATSAYSGYSSCRQYLADIERARDHVGPDAPDVVKVRPFWNHPGFVEAFVDRVTDALGQIDATDPRLVFTAHSIPAGVAAISDYQRQLEDAVRLVTAHIDSAGSADLVFQSRSGPPHVPWLEPDVVDHLRALHADDIDDVVVVPIGFVSDHMEVVYDLDVLAADAAADLGMDLVRAAAPGTHPRFVSGLVDLLDEHLVGAPALALGDLGARGPCRPDCCQH